MEPQAALPYTEIFSAWKNRVSIQHSHHQSPLVSVMSIHWKDWCSDTLATYAKSWLIRKDPDAGKDWRQEKGMTEDEMVGWHNWLDGHEFEQAPGVGDEQGSLACCSPRGYKRVGYNWVAELNWSHHQPWGSELLIRRRFECPHWIWLSPDVCELGEEGPSLVVDEQLAHP